MNEYVVEIILTSGQKWIRSFVCEKDATKWIKDFKKKHKSVSIKDLIVTSNEREIDAMIEKVDSENRLLRSINQKRLKFMNDFGFSRNYLDEEKDFEEIKRLDEIDIIEKKLKDLMDSKDIEIT